MNLTSLPELSKPHLSSSSLINDHVATTTSPFSHCIISNATNHLTHLPPPPPPTTTNPHALQTPRNTPHLIPPPLPHPHNHNPHALPALPNPQHNLRAPTLQRSPRPLLRPRISRRPLESSLAFLLRALPPSPHSCAFSARNGTVEDAEVECVVECCGGVCDVCCVGWGRWYVYPIRAFSSSVRKESEEKKVRKRK